jgi:ABC-type lipoprotein export system ATPase subunit
LNREEEITMIIVTHDPDVATYANRNIHFKDGTIQKDGVLAHPRDAQKDLESLPAEAAELVAV